MYSNHRYNKPADTGVAPDLANLIMVGEIVNAKNIWAREKLHDNHKNCNTALITMFEEALNSDIITDVKTDVIATTDRTFLQVFTRYMANASYAMDSTLQRKSTTRSHTHKS